MRYLFYIVFTIFSFSSTYCQNLVLNGSFEEQNTCTEFNAQCAPVAWKAVADNHYMGASGREEEGRSSSIIFQKTDVADYRTYICTRLLCPLQRDSMYRISFYVKADLKKLPTLSFNFTTTELSTPTCKRVDISPTITFTSKYLVSAYKPQKWVQIMYNYHAKGDEKYLTIGNFSKDDKELGQGLYVKNILCDIDDVSIEPNSKTGIPCVESTQIMTEIRNDKDRHKPYALIQRRLLLKESYTNGKDYNPNTTKISMPCAGDEWEKEYLIDTLRIDYSRVSQNWTDFKITIKTQYAEKKAACLGVTVHIYTDASNTPEATQIEMKQGYEVGEKVCEALGFEKSALCIQKKKGVHRQSVVHSAQSGGIVVLFLMEEN